MCRGGPGILVSCPRNSRYIAGGQLAVFQGGPSRTGGKAPISESYGSIRPGPEGRKAVLLPRRRYANTPTRRHVPPGTYRFQRRSSSSRRDSSRSSRSWNRRSTASLMAPRSRKSIKVLLCIPINSPSSETSSFMYRASG
jgi:hypothetical protein